MTPEEPRGIVDVLQSQNALLRQQVADLEAERAADKAQIAALEKRIGEREALKTPPPPWATVNRPKSDKHEGQRRKGRDSTPNHGRRKMTPTRIVLHAYECCPACAYALRGTAIARRREVIDLPETPIVVTEHHIIKRFCPVCQAWKTPAVSFEGVVRGQERIGLRLMSLIGVLRVVHRLPLTLIQDLLDQVYGLRLSEGGIQQVLDRLCRGLAPMHAAIVAQGRASPSRHMDATGWREDGQNGYLWVDATEARSQRGCIPIGRVVRVRSPTNLWAPMTACS